MNDNAIRAIHTNVVTIIGDTAYDNSGDEVTIDEAQVNAWVDPNAYKEQRAEEYPLMADYLDGIVKGNDAQVQKYIDDCLAVKAKYPKAKIVGHRDLSPDKNDDGEITSDEWLKSCPCFNAEIEYMDLQPKNFKPLSKAGKDYLNKKVDAK